MFPKSAPILAIRQGLAISSPELLETAFEDCPVCPLCTSGERELYRAFRDFEKMQQGGEEARP
jgi:hypothetical protein